MTGRDGTATLETAQHIEKFATVGRVLSCPGDLSSEDGCARLAEIVQKQFGRLDHLVCNIGSGSSVPPLQDDKAEWQRVFEINLYPSIAAVTAFRPLLSAAGGKRHSTITMIGSICGSEALGCPLAYGAAKSALASYVGNAAKPLAKEGIRINGVIPGNVMFPGSTWEQKQIDTPEMVQEMLDAQVPLGCFGEPEDIANVVLFLSSPRARFVTGANWVVDGGQTRGY